MTELVKSLAQYIVTQEPLPNGVAVKTYAACVSGSMWEGLATHLQMVMHVPRHQGTKDLV